MAATATRRAGNVPGRRYGGSNSAIACIGKAPYALAMTIVVRVSHRETDAAPTFAGHDFAATISGTALGSAIRDPSMQGVLRP